jgi:ElaB/YqjD/DUF883 family membrane-anchored ribosome-binding protein
MGKDPSTESPAVTETQDPQEIQREIEDTREELGDTVEALAAKTDVKAQAKHKINDAKSSTAQTKEKLMGKAREASPESAARAATQVTEKVRRNPFPVAAVGVFAAGFVAGRLSGR